MGGVDALDLRHLDNQWGKWGPSPVLDAKVIDPATRYTSLNAFCKAHNVANNKCPNVNAWKKCAVWTTCVGADNRCVLAPHQDWIEASFFRSSRPYHHP